MNVAIIGTGNVATIFGKLVKSAGHNIVALSGRNKENTQKLARSLETSYYDSLTKLPEADIYIIAVSDSSIKEVANNIIAGNKIVVHTSGSISKGVLENCSENFGVLYPLQSLRKENSDDIVIPLLIDASNQSTLDLLKFFAATLSNKISVVNDEQRLQLHVAAVIVSNFTNYMYTLTKEYCGKENISFNMLLPLIQETANRLERFDPKDVQTGPAIRNDQITIQRHLQFLSNYPELKEIYQSFSKGILHYYHNKGDVK